MPTQQNNSTYFGAYLYSAGAQHRHLHHLFVTTKKVTYYIPWTNTGTGASFSQHRKNSGEALKKCRWMDREGENWQGRNPWQKAQQSWLYTDLLQPFKAEPFSSGYSTDGSLISASAVPQCGSVWEAELSVQNGCGFVIGSYFPVNRTGSPRDQQNAVISRCLHSHLQRHFLLVVYWTTSTLARRRVSALQTCPPF